MGAIAEELRQPPASDHEDEPPALPPPTSEPPALPPPAPSLTPKAAALVASFDAEVEAFKPLLAKRTADFIASTKPDHELEAIANFLAQIIAARQPVVEEPKLLSAPPALSPPSTCGADDHARRGRIC